MCVCVSFKSILPSAINSTLKTEEKVIEVKKIFVAKETSKPTICILAVAEINSIFITSFFQGKLISREHYNDIVEERAITNLCGYPVCPKFLGKV